MQDDGKPLSDEEINKMANKEWLKDWIDILSRLWEAIDKPIDPIRFKVYRRELANVPIGILEKAISRCIQENTYLTVPPIGKVWESIRIELGNPTDIDQAIVQWIDSQQAIIDRCIYQFPNLAGKSNG